MVASAALQFRCHAFSSSPSPLSRRSPGGSSIRAGEGFRPSAGKAVADDHVGDGEEDRSRPNIVVIKTHEDYVRFIEEDDRLCIIKFYANWCKSCQRFGLKYRHLAFDRGDRVDAEGSIYHTGDVRFAEAEYSASAKLCKALKVRKLPTVHMHVAGRGRVADMCCKPSQFQMVVDEVQRQLDGTAVVEVMAESSTPVIEAEAKVEAGMAAMGDNATDAGDSFDEAMTNGSSLADEIMASLRGKAERQQGSSGEKEKSWFPFSF